MSEDFKQMKMQTLYYKVPSTHLTTFSISIYSMVQVEINNS